MTLRSALLSFRIQRFETTIVVGATILSVVVSAIAIGLFTSGGYQQCFGGDGPVLTALCQSPMATILGRVLRTSVSMVPFFPVVAGLLAGGPIVARELEAGTARLAWSLGPSRLRWFVMRAIPLLVLVAVAGLAIGVTSEALMAAQAPGVDLAASFSGFHFRGMLVGVEALLAASIALAVGSILGRLVPTMLLTLVLIGAFVAAIDKVERTVFLNEASMAVQEYLPDGSMTSSDYDWNRDLYLESRMKFANGDILTYEQAVATHPEINEPWTDVPPYNDVTLFIPGARYGDVEWREAIALAALALGFVALAAVAVVRRRPR